MSRTPPRQQPDADEDPSDEGLDQISMDEFVLLDDMQENLGKGSFGVVNKIRRKKTGKIYALKSMRKQEVIEGNLVNQVELEIQVQRKLKHRNVLRLFRHFEDDDTVYLLLEYCAKGELYQILRTQKGRRFSEGMACKLFVQVAEGLDYLHSNGIIHRDIKPENLLLDHDDVLKIADFGWCAELNVSRTTFCGTLDYLAPEMIQGKGHNHTLDVWSAGVLLYEMIVGRPPFQSTHHGQLISRILNLELVFPGFMSTDARELVTHLLQREPASRLPLQDATKHPWVRRQKVCEQTIETKSKLQESADRGKNPSAGNLTASKTPAGLEREQPENPRRVSGPVGESKAKTETLADVSSTEILAENGVSRAASTTVVSGTSSGASIRSPNKSPRMLSRPDMSGTHPAPTGTSASPSRGPQPRVTSRPSQHQPHQPQQQSHLPQQPHQQSPQHHTQQQRQRLQQQHQQQAESTHSRSHPPNDSDSELSSDQRCKSAIRPTPSTQQGSASQAVVYRPVAASPVMAYRSLDGSWKGLQDTSTFSHQNTSAPTTPVQRVPYRTGPQSPSPEFRSTNQHYPHDENDVRLKYGTTKIGNAEIPLQHTTSQRSLAAGGRPPSGVPLATTSLAPTVQSRTRRTSTATQGVLAASQSPVLKTRTHVGEATFAGENQIAERTNSRPGMVTDDDKVPSRNRDSTARARCPATQRKISQTRPAVMAQSLAVRPGAPANYGVQAVHMSPTNGSRNILGGTRAMTAAAE